MINVQETIDAALTEHAQQITNIEGFMEVHAGKASATDPIWLQQTLERIKSHTERLAHIMAKFPIVT